LRDDHGVERPHELVIQRTRKRALRWTISSLVLSAGGVGLIATGSTSEVVIGALSVLGFVPAAVYFGRDVIRPQPVLILSDEGLNCVYLRRPVMFPWSRITAVRVLERSQGVKTVGVTVRDPETLLPPPGPVQRRLSGRWGQRAIKGALAALEVANDPGLGGLSDAAGTLREDIAQHSTIEIAVTGLPIKADALAALLRARVPEAAGTQASGDR
jgi:hypothetical protein